MGFGEHGWRPRVATVKFSQPPGATDGEPQIGVSDIRTDFVVTASVGGSFRNSQLLQLGSDHGRAGPFGGPRHLWHGPSGLRVIAGRAATLRVPKLGMVESGRPQATYHADKAVRAFRRGFIAVLSEDQNRRILGNGWRRRAASESDLSVSIRHQVLVQWSHGGIKRLGALRAHWPRHAYYSNQRESSYCDCPEHFSVH